MGLCPNQGCEQLFNTDGDLERHMRYHCGNNGNPFNCQNRPEEVRRNTLHGFGIPKRRFTSISGGIFFNETLLTWNRTICDFARNEYQCHQVYGHVKAKQWYESRIQNGRWNIPFGQQYKKPPDIQLPKNIPAAIQFSVNTDKIRLLSIEPEIWECTQCDTQKNNARNLLIHVAIAHQQITRADINAHIAPSHFII